MKCMGPNGKRYVPFQHLRQAQNLSHKYQSWPQSQDLLSQLNRQVPLLQTIYCFKSLKVSGRHQSYSHLCENCGLAVHQSQIHKTWNSLSLPEQYRASVWCKGEKKLKRCKSIILFEFFPLVEWMSKRTVKTCCSTPAYGHFCWQASLHKPQMRCSSWNNIVSCHEQTASVMH